MKKILAVILIFFAFVLYACERNVPRSVSGGPEAGDAAPAETEASVPDGDQEAPGGSTGAAEELLREVYRTVAVKASVYSKTTGADRSSLSEERIKGCELWQAAPTPEDVENLQNYKSDNGWFYKNDRQGISYECRWEETEDSGGDYALKSYVEKYDGEDLVWSVEISEFLADGCRAVSDGVIVFGQTDILTNADIIYAWMIKIGEDGSILWTRKLENGFQDEYIAAVLEKDDGSYAVISRGDLQYFCFSRIGADGSMLHSRKTEVGYYGIWDAACLGEDYIVQLGSYMTGEYSTIVMVDSAGCITESFAYSGEDLDYCITDMTEYNGNLWLSAYTTPKLGEGEHTYGGRTEIVRILEYVYSRNCVDIPSEELTPVVRDNYTAVLLVCDPYDGGKLRTFYTVSGSMGAELILDRDGRLIWQTQSITDTFFSPATSSFTIGGTSCVFRYTFDEDGLLIGAEKTDTIADYRR